MTSRFRFALPASPMAPLLLAAACLMSGCASTTVQLSGTPPTQALCRADTPKLAVSVLWGTRWRPDQKEPPLREAAALRGIERYFQSQPCVQSLAIHRLSPPEAPAPLTDTQVLAMARTAGDQPDRVVLLFVRELGPKLRIGLPVLVEGGTEVVLEARLIDASSASSLADVQAHWYKGGPFYIKGVKTLDQDMQTTLEALFSAPAGGASDIKPSRLER